jgi:very-short-patch-repair endonuclease
MGWVVLRFWGYEINKNLIGCVNEIKEAIFEIKNGIFAEEQKYKADMYAAESI